VVYVTQLIAYVLRRLIFDIYVNE